MDMIRLSVNIIFAVVGMLMFIVGFLQWLLPPYDEDEPTRSREQRGCIAMAIAIALLTISLGLI